MSCSFPWPGRGFSFLFWSGGNHPVSRKQQQHACLSVCAVQILFSPPSGCLCSRQSLCDSRSQTAISSPASHQIIPPLHTFYHVSAQPAASPPSRRAYFLFIPHSRSRPSCEAPACNTACVSFISPSRTRLILHQCRLPPVFSRRGGRPPRCGINHVNAANYLRAMERRLWQIAACAVNICACTRVGAVG